MAKYNTTFELNVDDMELIETALRKVQGADGKDDANRVSELLGRLHNQKVFYRPKGVYVGG